MSYLVYNGKLVQSGSKYLAANAVKLLNLNGSTNVGFGSTNDNIRGSKKISWKMYFEDISSWAQRAPINLINTSVDPTIVSNDSFTFAIQGSNMFVSTGTFAAGNQKSIGLAAFAGQILTVEVEKSYSDPTGFIDSWIINGNTITSTGQITGAGYTSNWSIQSADKDMFIWDLRVIDDPGGADTLLHYWKGYPDGGQNSSWLDQVGNKNGTLSGSPQETRIFTQW